MGFDRRQRTSRTIASSAGHTNAFSSRSSTDEYREFVHQRNVILGVLGDGRYRPAMVASERKPKKVDAKDMLEHSDENERGGTRGGCHFHRLT